MKWYNENWNEIDPPAHLKDDASYLYCDSCGRKTWDSDLKSKKCGMIQPDGNRCQGIFRTKLPEKKCWFCGADNPLRLTLWEVESPGENEVFYMCNTHTATTKVALKLRELGETALADELDQGIGIETHPKFIKWRIPDGNV